MPVPKMSQLGEGKIVNIVLKADQPTGRLTTGKIADILTRGEHPRGIKVRLQDGQIGRVQSVLGSQEGETPVQRRPPYHADLAHQQGRSGHQGLRLKGRKKRQTRGQDTSEHNFGKSSEASLFDYVREPRASSSPAMRSSEESSKQVSAHVDNQKRLEKEYPTLDTALIAAILADYADLTKAREVLSELG
ncbi:MAG: hypothetical protein Q9227_004768 [Pyrenula ochraceoflavens]